MLVFGHIVPIIVIRVRIRRGNIHATAGQRFFHCENVKASSETGDFANITFLRLSSLFFVKPISRRGFFSANFFVARTRSSGHLSFSRDHFFDIENFGPCPNDP